MVYHLVYVRRRRRLSVSVDRYGTLQVRVPWHITHAQVVQFLRDQTAWIVRRVAQVRRAVAERPTLRQGSVVPFLGTSLQVYFSEVCVRPIFRDGSRLWIAGPDHPEREVVALLEGWYRQQANRHLPVCLKRWSAVLALPFDRVTIRSQKSRWGSCSTKRTISLNWRLMFLPVPVVDYVLVHELCHLKHMNHSADFWAMVARFIPDHAACRQKLRVFSAPW